MKKKSVFFVLGMRRAGTSILRRIISKSPGVDKCLFEPHEIFYAASLAQIQRYKDHPFVVNTLRKFKSQANSSSGRIGAKFPLNPGTHGMQWKYLNSTFPTCQFVFIIRDIDDNYASYKQQDKKSVRGYIEDRYVYDYFYNRFNAEFMEFTKANPERGIMFSYDSLVENGGNILDPLWPFLGVQPPKPAAFNDIHEPKHWKTKIKEEVNVDVGVNEVNEVNEVDEVNVDVNVNATELSHLLNMSVSTSVQDQTDETDNINGINEPECTNKMKGTGDNENAETS